MSLIEGWKLVRKDGSTRNGYRWPMPVAGITDPVVVEALDVNPDNKKGCPSGPGDGLCVALTPAGASSGGIALSEGVGLSLTYDEADVLGREDTKLRVARVTVVDTFDPLAKVRDGEWKDLVGASLTGAVLAWASLTDVDLSWADLSGANLSGAILYGANLSGTDLHRAVLTGAYLIGAYGEPQSGMPDGWRLDAQGRWERDQ